MNRNKSLRIFMPRGMKAVIEESGNMEEVKMEIIENGKTVQTINMPINSTPHNKNDTPANEHGISNDRNQKPQFMQAKVKDEYQIFSVKDITWIKCDGTYSNVHLHNDERIVVSKPLNSILQSLDCDYIVRVHKSYAINIEHATSRKDNCIVVDGMNIPIGRGYKQNLKKMIKSIG